MISDMRSIDEIKKLALKVPFLNDPEVFFLSEGFGNYNYTLEEGGKKYVLRIKKSEETQFSDSLEKEYVFLKYFRHKGVNFCPDVYFYDREDNFLIEDFLEGIEVSQNDFSVEQIDLFAKQLQELFALEVSDFPFFAAENQCKKFGYVSPLVSLDRYGFNRFETAKKSGLDAEVSSWINARLKRNRSYLKKMEERKETLGFAWGDIQSRVIVGSEGRMYFYDFEHVAVSNNFGLSYIKIHGSFNDSQFTYLVERCALYFNKTISELLSEITAEENIIRVNDVVWAAMKWAETGDDEFKNTMLKRMKLAEKLD
jgi:hypothetical protein